MELETWLTKMFSAKIWSKINLHICENIPCNFISRYLGGREERTLANYLRTLDSSLCSSVSGFQHERTSHRPGDGGGKPVRDHALVTAQEKQSLKIRQKNKWEKISWIISQSPKHHLVTLLMGSDPDVIKPLTIFIQKPLIIHSS